MWIDDDFMHCDDGTIILRDFEGSSLGKRF